MRHNVTLIPGEGIGPEVAHAARRIERALQSVCRKGRLVTRDVGGSATTEQFTAAVIAAMGKA